MLTHIWEWILNNEESIRVLVYCRDFPEKVLWNEVASKSDDVIDNFTNECCRLINKIYRVRKNLIGKQQSDGEVYPDLVKLGVHGKPELPGLETTKNYSYFVFCFAKTHFSGHFNVRDAVLEPLLPITDEKLGNGLFTSDDIFCTALTTRAYTQQIYEEATDDDKRWEITEGLYNEQHIEWQIRRTLTEKKNRLLCGRTQPVVQVLFVLYAYWNTENEHLNFKPFYDALSHSIADKLISRYGILPEQLDLAADKLKKALAEPIKIEKPAPQKKLPEPETKIPEPKNEASPFQQLLQCTADDKDRVMARLHELLDGKGGKQVALILAAAMYKYHYIISMPTEKQYTSTFRLTGSWKAISSYIKAHTTSNGIFNESIDHIEI